MPNNVHAESTDLKLDKVDIKFVGPAVRKGLAKGRIQTVADLAGSSVDEIESILENEGLPSITRTAEKIEEMIQEAKILVAAQSNSDAQTNSAPVDNQLTKVLEFTLFFNYGYSEDDQKRWRALIHPHAHGDSLEPPTWHPNPGDEGYTVRFECQPSEDGQESWRTLVYIGKSRSVDETDITGWTPDEWWPWIAEKASLVKEALQTTVQEEEVIETIAPSINDKPSEAEEYQPEKALRITRIEHHLTPDNGAKKLVVNVDFEISKELLAEQPSSFQVGVLYEDLEKNVSQYAGLSNIKPVPEKRKYESRIVCDLPKLGEYRPRCIVSSLPSRELQDYKKGDKITIIPKK
jgi:hypothetical protein